MVTAGKAKLVALVEADPDVMDELIALYLAAYSGGAFSALINVPWMPGDPLSDVRVHMATTYAQHMAKTVEGDPAVMLSLAEGLAASLRGEDPEPTVMKSHAGSGS